MNSLGGFKLPVCWTSVLLFLGATWMPALSAQVVQGTITGNVSDSTGALVPGVDIIIKNEDIGVVTRTTSTSGGVYTVTLLPPGKYSITAELTGFQRLEIKGLELGSAQTVRQDLSLQIGSLVDSVTVESSAGLISTDTTSIQTALATKQLEALPVSLQNIDALLILAAGVGRATFQSAPQIAGSTHWGANNFTLNGVSVNDPGNGAGAYSAGLGGVNFPALSSLQEVNIAGINLDARYGRVVQVSMVTKNGTNQFHGDAYEYVQNDVLNATPFQVNAAGQKKPRFQRHQFGLDVGGPIFRNRTFFFFGYGGTRQNTPREVQLNLPTMAQRQGNPENRSNTNQGQLEVKRRFSGGLLLQAQYQWTKVLELAPALGGPQNPFDIEADYGHSSYLAKHTLAVNYVYELPFGHGRRWLKTGALAYIAGGWNVSGITSLLSGLPFSVSFQVPAAKSVGSAVEPMWCQEWTLTFAISRTIEGLYGLTPRPLRRPSPAPGGTRAATSCGDPATITGI